MYSPEIEAHLEKGGIKIGDRIVFKSGKGTFEGVLMPRYEIGDERILVLKLDNGYNVGIRFENDAEIERIGSSKNDFSFPKAAASRSDALRDVTLVYTGGTIGSKVDYTTGGVYMLKKPEEMLFEVPELSEIANIEVNNLMSIASEDMTHEEWGMIAHAAADALNKGAKGVVITHGTDTMHYTSAALSFMLKGLKAPIVLTGSQRSSDRGSSDAFMNLICSVSLAARSDIAEVGICMHESSSDTSCTFIRGTKARKMHTSRRDAFKAVNSRPMARVSYDGSIEYLSDYNHSTAGAEGKVSVADGFEPKVAIVKAHPNSDPDVIDYYASKGFKGLILEGTGLGHVPTSPSTKSYSWIESVKRAADSGMVIGVASQCVFGRVNDKVYRNLRVLGSAGAIHCEDMTTETAFVKLGWLLGNYESDKAKDLLSMNICGEIGSRTMYSDHLE